jgi:hypothetical protein
MERPQLQVRLHPLRVWAALVKLWPEPLRGEAKIAFADLCEKSISIHSTTLVVSPAELGSLQGRGDAAGRRCLRGLEKEKLIDIVDTIGGRWRVAILNPAKEAIARRVKIGDVQLELFDVELSGLDGEQGPHDAAGSGEPGDGLSGPAHILPIAGGIGSPASDEAVGEAQRAPRPPGLVDDQAASDVAPHPTAAPDVAVEASEVAPHPTAPRTRENLGTSERFSNKPTSDTSETLGSHNVLKFQGTSREANGVGCGSASDGGRDPARLGDVLGRYEPRQPRPWTKPELEARIASIVDGVRDRKLKLAPVVKVARAVVEGALPVSEVDESIKQLDAADRRGELAATNCPRYAYWVGTMRNRIFPRWGIPWERPAQPR